MKEIKKPTASSTTQVWITIASALFIGALIISALVVPQLRPLHFLQSLIYVVIVILARRNSMWSFGAGVTIGIAWNSLNIFVTHLMQEGAFEFWSFIRTGRTGRIETMTVTLGGIAHFILITACLIAVFRQKSDSKNWRKFAGGGALVLAYMALIIAVARPR